MVAFRYLLADAQRKCGREKEIFLKKVSSGFPATLGHIAEMGRAVLNAP